MNHYVLSRSPALPSNPIEKLAFDRVPRLEDWRLVLATNTNNEYIVADDRIGKK